MATVNCSPIREMFLAGVSENTTAQNFRDTSCVVSVAIPTVDGRNVDIFIEPRNADFYLVHDGGKAFNEMILQGEQVTAATEQRFTMIAKAYGVNFLDEMFQGACKIDRLYSVAIGVAMCSSIAVADLACHFQSTEDEPVRDQVEVALRAWAKRHAKLSRDEKIIGTIKQHTFDFVARAKGQVPICISVLSPGSSSVGTAERFGFKVQDISGTKVKEWPKLVIEARADAWSKPARRIIDKCADLVVSVRSDEAISIPAINKAMAQLQRKAA